MISEFIQQLRKNSNLTQEFIASRIGVSRPTYIQIEKGKRYCNIYPFLLSIIIWHATGIVSIYAKRFVISLNTRICVCRAALSYINCGLRYVRWNLIEQK